MSKKLYSRDIPDKVADVLHRFRCGKSEHAKGCKCATYTSGIYAAEAEYVLDALTETFEAIREEGYWNGYEDGLSEPPF